jgi:hypothetical protein
MTTWPAATKASTTHVDQGTDQISLARADIKQNMDNVNDIIDIFNIASPTNGDMMQYNSSTTKWEKVASTAVGSSVKAAQLTIDSTNDAVTGGYRFLLSKGTGIDDADSIITLSDSNYRFALTAGTYQLVMSQTTGATDSSNDTTFKWYNITDDTDVGTPQIINRRAASPIPSYVTCDRNMFILTSTKTFEYRSDQASFKSISGFYILKLK